MSREDQGGMLWIFIAQGVCVAYDVMRVGMSSLGLPRVMPSGNGLPLMILCS